MGQDFWYVQVSMALWVKTAKVAALLMLFSISYWTSGSLGSSTPRRMLMMTPIEYWSSSLSVSRCSDSSSMMPNFLIGAAGYSLRGLLLTVVVVLDENGNKEEGKFLVYFTSFDYSVVSK